MKKLILLVFSIVLFASCTTDYIAKDDTGAAILIKDMHDVIKDAQKVGADSIYLVKYMREEHYTPLRRMGENTLNSWEYEFQGKKQTAYALYRRIHIDQVYER